jgi:hypothetical protein
MPQASATTVAARVTSTRCLKECIIDWPGNPLLADKPEESSTPFSIGMAGKSEQYASECR